MPTEHPIIFSDEFASAIATGRPTKTVTRRVLSVPWGKKGQWRVPPWSPYYVEDEGELVVMDADGDYHTAAERLRCPFGSPGDRLWVREAHWLQDGAHDPWPDLPSVVGSHKGHTARCYFRASFDRCEPRWRPSIHMPRWASRSILEVLSVRPERLQAITEADAQREGYDFSNIPAGGAYSGFQARLWFQDQWDELHAEPRPRRQGGRVAYYVSYPWNDHQEVREYRGRPWHVLGNPWVWRIEFRKVTADD